MPVDGHFYVHHPDGTDIYTAYGDAGAIQLIIDYIEALGKHVPRGIGIHGAVYLGYGNAEPTECDVLLSKKCFADVGWRAGEEGYGILRREGTEALYSYLDTWYEDRLAPLEEKGKT